MSFSTIYVLTDPSSGEVQRVSLSTSAADAVAYWQMMENRGTVLACSLSPSAAWELRQLTQRGDHAKATKHMRTFAHSIQHCGDVT